MVKIAVNGAAGRMGSRILALAGEAPDDFKVVGAFDEDKKSSRLSAEALKKEGRGVLIDFSSPAGAAWALSQASAAGWGLVLGTTGLDAKTHSAAEAAAKGIPIVLSANMSVGVNVVLELLQLAAKKLPDNFGIEITEAHHRHKKDAPSGTALMLARAIAAVKKWDLKKVLKFRGEGSIGERPKEEIGMQVIRAGEIVGDHAVLFAGPAETIEITHRAQSRDTFAQGALVAALFLSKKNTGLYAMADVLK